MSALVRIEGERVVADSRDVAAQFGKQHAHVLRAIDDMVKTKPDLAPNFGAMIYAVKTAKGATRSSRRFDMDRKGFMLLVMGFQGAKALEIKSKWIDAFDAMERALVLGRQDAVNDAAEPVPSPIGINDLRERLLFVREARTIGGRNAGRRAWDLVGLPDVWDKEPVLLTKHEKTRAMIDAMMERPANPNVEAWARDRLRICRGGRSKVSDLFADYAQWAPKNGRIVAISIQCFGRAMTRLGLETIHSNGSWLLDHVLAD